MHWLDVAYFPVPHCSFFWYFLGIFLLLYFCWFYCCVLRYINPPWFCFFSQLVHTKFCPYTVYVFGHLTTVLSCGKPWLSIFTTPLRVHPVCPFPTMLSVLNPCPQLFILTPPPLLSVFLMCLIPLAPPPNPSPINPDHFCVYLSDCANVSKSGNFPATSATIRTYICPSVSPCTSFPCSSVCIWTVQPIRTHLSPSTPINVDPYPSVVSLSYFVKFKVILGRSV